jgi:hypothetical protein
MWLMDAAAAMHCIDTSVKEIIKHITSRDFKSVNDWKP